MLLLGLALIVIAIASECACVAGKYGVYKEIMKVLNRIVHVLGVWWFADLIVDRIKVRPWIRAVYKALFCKIRSNHK